MYEYIHMNQNHQCGKLVLMQITEYGSEAGKINVHFFGITVYLETVTLSKWNKIFVGRHDSRTMKLELLMRNS